MHQQFKSNLYHPEVENQIRVLDGNSYEQIVSDVTRDVLVFVYKLECIHCKTVSHFSNKLLVITSVGINSLAKDKIRIEQSNNCQN